MICLYKLKVASYIYFSSAGGCEEGIELKNLVPRPSEFEQVRRRVIVILNVTYELSDTKGY